VTHVAERSGGIVLAGGRSSRFGSDKLAVLIGGRPMLELAIDAVRAVATDIVVVGAPGRTPPLPPDVTVAFDDDAFEGPLAGLATGLRALDPGLDRAIVVGGDMPSLQPTVLGQFLDRLDVVDIVVLEDADGPRPLPMAVRTATVRPTVDRLLVGGERRLRALLTELTVESIDRAAWQREDPEGQTLRDIDRPEDLPG
jgi:molybdopterin-guanine dinucleotide biosynthesis protein A